MTIKVIKRGIPEEEKRYIVTCHNCKSELEVSKADGRTRSNQHAGDDWSCTCPVCLHVLTVAYPSGLKLVAASTNTYGESHNRSYWKDR